MVDAKHHNRRLGVAVPVAEKGGDHADRKKAVGEVGGQSCRGNLHGHRIGQRLFKIVHPVVFAHNIPLKPVQRCVLPWRKE